MMKKYFRFTRWDGAKSWFVIFMGIIMGGGFFSAGIYFCYKELRLHSSGITTTASVTGKDKKQVDAPKTRYYLNYFLNYEFKTSTGEVVQAKRLVRKSTFDNADDSITIIYDPANPSNNAVINDAFRWLIMIMLLILGIAGLALPVLWHCEFDSRHVTPDKIPGGARAIFLKVFSETRPSYAIYYLAWNVILFLIIGFAWEDIPWFGWLILSPLIIIGILMLIGTIQAVASIINPFFLLSLSELPSTGRSVQLHWIGTGHTTALNRLEITILGRKEKGDPIVLAVLDSTDRTQFSMGKINLTLPPLVQSVNINQTSTDHNQFLSWRISIHGYRHF